MKLIGGCLILTGKGRFFNRDRIWRLVTFFKRGYGSWISYVFGLANFVVLQYSLLISGVPFLQSVFTSVWVFVAVFGAEESSDLRIGKS